ncbi:MAG: hypothetical protein E7Y34_01885, partial [Mycoplasma sp.]|nr:hypothetical protein [Mycoplasma sp.]
MKLFFTKKKIENTDYYKTGKLGKIIFIKFLFKFYVKSFYQPFLTFILPSFLFLILTTITFWQIALPGMFAMAIMVIGINSTPFILTELKSSIVLKRMGVSPFKKKDIIGSIIIFVTFQ